MKYTEEQIRELARDAKIALTDEEVARYAEELGQLAELAAVLCEIPLSGRVGSAELCVDMAGMRDDLPASGYARDALMQVSSRSRDGYFVVPRTVEE